MRGIAKRATTDRLHIQKAPLIFTGLKIRERSNPAEKENSSRKEPPVNSVPVNEYPTQISPKGPKMANAAKPHPAAKTNTVRAFVESFRMNKA